MINEDDFDIEYKPLDIDLIRKNINTYSSQKLVEMIVCDRYFGCYREIAIICMEELSRRRTGGDNFHFESHIDNGLKELPDLNINGINLRDVLQQAIGRKINK
jgi:hypothetical protein